jgi:hypothetical protein
MPAFPPRFGHKRDFILQKPLVDIYAHIWQKHAEKGSAAMPKTAALDQLQQVHELNRAFVGLLQSRVLERRSCLCLPASAHAAVAAAPSSMLERAAAFPCALFQVRIPSGAWPAGLDAGADLDDAERHLCLSILFAVRQTSRESPYQARLLFGLVPDDVERLRAAALADVQQLACVPGVLRCAFAERDWFWRKLFTAERPEVRRQLTLLALQPCLAMGWPQRRPPQPAA